MKKIYSLLRVKVDAPTIEEFHGNHKGNTVPLWYNDRNRIMHQPQRKVHKKRWKKTESESLSFNLPSIFEDSDLGCDNSTEKYGRTSNRKSNLL